MSDYTSYYEERPRRRDGPRTRVREPEYVEETTYVQRGAGHPSSELVYRGRDREDSIEDIPRDFPPPGGEYRRTRYREKDYGPPRRARSDYSDDDDTYYAPSRPRQRESRRDRDQDYYSDDYERPRPERRKSMADQAKEFAEGLGLGGVVGGLVNRARSSSRGRDDKYKSRRDDRYSDYSDRSRSRDRDRDRDRGGDSKKKWEQAAKAAVLAGAVEAFRARSMPGPWTGEKGQRIATAALGAAGIDSFLDKDPNKNDKRHIAEAAIGGLVANRLANGPRSRSQSRGPGARGRSSSRPGGIRERLRSLSRGRSKSRGPYDSESEEERKGGGNGLAKVAGAGAAIAAGKAIWDRVRSKSRGREKRDSSTSSRDSYDAPSRRRPYDRGRGRDVRSRGGPDDDNDRDWANGAAAGAGAGAGALAARNNYNNNDNDNDDDGENTNQRGNKKGSSSSDSESTTDMERQRKKMRGKELLTAGLATVATIHAAHGVYGSMVASEKRHKLVEEGKITAEEARKRKSKNLLQDAAAIGIAALGIKSAFSEWKEMNEQRHEVHELEKKREKRRKIRQKKERERREQMMYGGGMGGGYNGGYQPGYGQPMYNDGNPYGAAGTLPPPPMGGGGQRY